MQANLLRKFFATGFGNLHTQGRTIPSGPPFPAGSANSGLHVDTITGVIQLGSAGINPLLQNTDIDLGGFQLTASQAGSTYFILDATNHLFVLGDNSGSGNGNKLFIDDSNATRRSTLGDGSGVGQGTQLVIDDLNAQSKLGDPTAISDGSTLQIDSSIGNSELQFFDTAGTYLRFVPATGQYDIGQLVGSGGNGMQLNIRDASSLIVLGDTIPLGNQTVIQINDAGSSVFVGNVIAGTGVETQTITSTDGSFQFVGGGIPYFLLNNNALQYYMGDFTGSDNGTFMQMDDLNQSIKMFSYPTAHRFFQMDALNFDFSFGDLDGLGNNCFLEMDDLNSDIVLKASNVGSGGNVQLRMNGTNKDATIRESGNVYLKIDVAADNYTIGDQDTVTGGLFYQIDNAGLTHTMFAGVGVDKYLELNIATQNYIIGSITAGNGTRVTIDDSAGNQRVQLEGVNGIRTSPTILGNADDFLLGKVVAGAVALDATRFVDVNIAGVAVKLLVAA